MAETGGSAPPSETLSMPVAAPLQVRPSRQLHVRPSRPGEVAAPEPADLTGGAKPVLWMGAEPAGGLTLPDAMPTAHQVYAPRAVWLDDHRLIVADTGNHRVLIWHDVDSLTSHGQADVVLGQADMNSEGAQAAGRGPERGLRLPTGVVVSDGRLIVADAWNHRILIWDQVPTTSDVAPDVILGQADPTGVDENRGGGCGPLTFYWPFGIAVVGGRFYVADTGNRRVLAWDGIPGPDDQPELVLGQPSPSSRDENRGELGPNSFRWPHDIAGVHGPGPLGTGASSDGIVFIADAGNHRLLGWKPEPDRDRPADTVLGQTDFVSGAEFPYAPQTATALRFPYAVDINRGEADVAETAQEIMAVADTANNRILLWDGVPTESTVPADRVLGQPSFAVNGENRWELVGHDTFCWPYGLRLHRNRLAVADSGNNRVMIWDLS